MARVTRKKQSSKTKRTAAAVAAGAKGAKIRAAKKQARETGQIVILEAYGCSVHPDGQVIDVDAHVDVVTPANPNSELDVRLGDANAKTDPDFAEVDPTTEPATKIEAVNALVRAGWTEDAAFAMVAGKPPAPPAAILGPTGDPAAALDQAAIERERAEQQAAYLERMKDYVPPKLEEEFTVVVKLKFAKYLHQFAAMESVKRRREVTTADAIQMMVRKYWQNDAERHLLDAVAGVGASGPAGAFDEQTGTYA